MEEQGIWGTVREGCVGLFGICLCEKILNAVVVVVVVIVDLFYITLFSALEETHCARIRFCLRD